MKFLRLIDRQVPKGLQIHLILDNYGTHNHENVRAWLAKHPRFHLHFTPTSSSWLNLVLVNRPSIADGCHREYAGRTVEPVLTGALRAGPSSEGRLIERWFRNLTDKAIRRGVFRSVPDLVAAIEAYLEANNNDPKPFVWTATADEILNKVRRGRVTLEQITS